MITDETGAVDAPAGVGLAATSNPANQSANRKIDLLLIIILIFTVLIALGVWRGDFGEILMNGTTM